jgi:aryl-alcohol dehydrogenase-like predicted oxidoreductase
VEYVNLGRTGLKVSRLGLGTMNFGPQAPEPQSFAILDKAVEAGINLIDTADVYGWVDGDGVTECLLGRWLAESPSRRAQIVLATKLCVPMGKGPNDGGLSAYHIRRSCEDSLRRLGTDHIDLYQMHHVDRSTPWEEIWQAMDQLVREGKVLYVGSSNFAAWHIAVAQLRAEQRHLLGLASEQSLYNLKDRTIELEVIPACRALGVGLLAWSPLAGGLLAGEPGDAARGRRAGDEQLAERRRQRARLDPFAALCRELGESPAAVSLAWILANPDVSCPLIGPRDTAQLDESLRALEVRLDAAALQRLDEIWPGPGGEAPEAYSW